MRVAFLFIEQSPNYSLVFQVLSRLTTAELRKVNTYVRVGISNIDELFNENTKCIKTKRGVISNNIFFTQYGNIWDVNVDENKVINLLSTEIIYSVVFESLDEMTIRELHERMYLNQFYLGFTQILPITSHLRVFSLLQPLLKLDGNDICVLYSDLGDDEWFADEIIEWARQSYNSLTQNHLISNLQKKDIGSRFSIFDIKEKSLTDVQIQNTISLIGSEWNIQAERVFLRLMDVSPDAVEELVSGIAILNKEELTAAECAGVAVNFRRCLEKIAEAITPPLDKSESRSNECRDMGIYKYRLIKYIKGKGDKEYDGYMEDELEELYTRIKNLYNICNSGIHKDWLKPAFTTTVLRLILLISEFFLPTKIIKPTVIYEPGIFGE